MPLSARTFVALLAASAIAVVLVIVSANSTTTEAHAGQYAHFPGPAAGYVDVPDDPALNPTSAITLESWVFRTSHESWPSGQCPSVIGKGYQTSYWLGICGDIPSVYPKGGVGSYFDSTGVVPLNQWTHLAATYDGTTTSIYINGVLSGTTGAFTGAIGTNTDDVYIGADPDYLYSPVGAVDEVRLWNVARTGPEIAAAMNTTITTAQTGLVGVWNMEGDGSDTLGNHNGTTHGDIEFSATPLQSQTASPSPTPTVGPTDTPSVSPTPSPTPAPSAFQKGDGNCDGLLDENDILPYLKYSAGVGPFPAPCGASPAAAPQGGPLGQWLNPGASTGGYVSIPNDPALNPTGAITIEMLVNPYSYTSAGGNGCQSLVGKGFVTAYWLGLCYGHPRFYPRGAGSAKDTAGILPIRQWTHIAVVADATTLTFYINGVLDRQVTSASAPLTTDTSPVYIASDVDYDVRPWAAIDEVRIWNVARSQSDIQAAMNAHITVPQPGLVAAYQFEGNTDDATGAHNGAAVGTLDIGNNLPPVQWHDIDCNGLVDLPDALALLISAAGIPPSPAAGCEPIGAAESRSLPLLFPHGPSP